MIDRAPEQIEINAVKIPISKQNNVLCIITKLHKNEWKVYYVCQPQ